MLLSSLPFHFFYFISAETIYTICQNSISAQGKFYNMPKVEITEETIYKNIEFITSVKYQKVNFNFILFFALLIDYNGIVLLQVGKILHTLFFLLYCY